MVVNNPRQDTIKTQIFPSSYCLSYSCFCFRFAFLSLSLISFLSSLLLFITFISVPYFSFFFPSSLIFLTFLICSILVSLLFSSRSLFIYATFLISHFSSHIVYFVSSHFSFLIHISLFLPPRISYFFPIPICFVFLYFPFISTSFYSLSPSSFIQLLSSCLPTSVSLDDFNFFWCCCCQVARTRSRF